jgi:signal transduction histidine kinase
LVAFFLTLVVSIFFFQKMSDHLEEVRVASLAHAASRAFRPMILDRNIRDAQFEMARVLDLKTGEYAIVRDPQFEPIYSPDESTPDSRCKVIGKICQTDWGFINYLEPVYFDDDLKQNLFGYVEIHVASKSDSWLMAFFVVLLTAIFFVVVIGISSTQSGLVKLIRETMESWANHLKERPTEKAPNARVLFDEFKPMQSAISDLHFEIARLKTEAASEARFKAQLSMLREIGHDLKTPFSQLAKFISVYKSKVEKTGKSDQYVAERMMRSMNRVGDLIRQVESLEPRQLPCQQPRDWTDIATEAELFVDDFKKSLEASTLESIELRIETGYSMAAIPKAQFYRIVDNLLKNAMDASHGKLGRIQIQTFCEGGRPTLRVKDNGCGIRPEHLSKVFDAEFTTKPARGTGLGLSIVKKIVTNFQAEIFVDSEVDMGTEFKITFVPFIAPAVAAGSFQEEGVSL